MANHPYHGLFSDPLFKSLPFPGDFFSRWPLKKNPPLGGHGIQKGSLNILNHPKKGSRSQNCQGGGDNVSPIFKVLKCQVSFGEVFLLFDSWNPAGIARLVSASQLSIDGQVARTKTPRPAHLLQRWSQKPRLPITHPKIWGIFAYIFTIKHTEM